MSCRYAQINLICISHTNIIRFSQMSKRRAEALLKPLVEFLDHLLSIIPLINLSSLNDSEMSADSLNFAIANAFVRFHFDNLMSL